MSICTFDNKNLCGWKNSGKGKWVRGTRTPSGSTGAAKGQGGKGYFMFLETSSPSTKGWTSYLTAAAKGKTTLSFYYHMHGATMGSLSVHAQVGGKWKNLWSKKGQQQKKQGDKFIMAKVRQSCLTHPVSFLLHPPLSLQGAVQCPQRMPAALRGRYLRGRRRQAKARAAPCSCLQDAPMR